MLIAIILLVITLIALKSVADTQRIKERNMSDGGLKNILYRWMDFANENEMELVKDSGTDLEFRRKVYGNSGSFYEFYLNIHSKFINMATGWVVHSNGKKIKSGIVKLGRSPNTENVEEIFELIAKDLKSKGALNICYYSHIWEYDNDSYRICKECHTSHSKLVSTGKWMEDGTGRFFEK